MLIRVHGYAAYTVRRPAFFDYLDYKTVPPNFHHSEQKKNISWVAYFCPIFSCSLLANFFLRCSLLTNLVFLISLLPPCSFSHLFVIQVINKCWPILDDGWCLLCMTNLMQLLYDIFILLLGQKSNWATWIIMELIKKWLPYWQNLQFFFSIQVF